MKTVFTGITRNYSNEDGELEVMENLRHDGASLRPIGDAEKIDMYVNYGTESQREYQMEDNEKIVFVHQFRGRDFVITYKEGELRLLGERIENVIVVMETPYIILSCSHPIRIVQNGAYIYIHTEDKDYLRLMKYRTSLEEITYSNSDIKEINIQMQVMEECHEETDLLYNKDSAPDLEGYMQGARYGTEHGNFNSILNPFKEKGFLIGAALVRGAFKLKSGSYALHTAPVLIHPNNDGKCMVIREDIPTGAHVAEFKGEQYWDGFYAYYTLKGAKIKVRIREIKDILKYSEEIECFDIFIAEIPTFSQATKPLYIKDPNMVVGNIGFDKGSEVVVYGRIQTSYPFYYNEGSLKEKILGVSSENYKFIKRYTLNDLRRGVYGDYLPLEDFYKENIKLEEESVLPSFNFEESAYRDTYVGTPFIYNSQLHLCGVSASFFRGYSPESFFSSPGEEGLFVNNIGFKWEGDGVSVGKNSSNPVGDLGYMIAYPKKDMDVCTIKAMAYDNERGEFGYAEKKLVQNDIFLNEDMSCFFGEIEKGSYTYYSVELERKTATYERFKKIELDYRWKDEYEEDYTDFNLQPNKDISNKLKVSEVLEPYNFPYKKDVLIGEERILDMNVASTALSQGQYGQFPLYVFCSDGIYAMNVGTGDVAYTNTTPVSRDVLTGDLISIDKAIAFISDRSLKILQGDTVVDVSLQMQSNAYEQLQGETFEDFIKDAKLAYNYFFGEIYLLREDKEFAFVYELKNQTWATRKIDFKGKLDVYPDLYIQSEEGVYRLSREIYPPEGTQKVKLKTRPMKWGDGFKKVARMIIRGLVIGNWDIKILASNDGVNFHEIRRASITTDTPKRDIPFGRISGSFKSYVLEIEADMDERAYIEYVETELQDSIFNKKIR